MRRRKRNKFLPLILLLFFTMSLGFAYLRTSLSINGRANIKDNSWNIYFDNVQVKDGSVTPVTAPTIPSNNKTSISFDVELKRPGDYYEFTVDIVNGGSIDAMIDSINIVPKLTEEQEKYLEYDVRYDCLADINKKDLLAAGTREKIKVKYKFENNVPDDDLPSENAIFVTRIEIGYVPAEGANPVVYPAILQSKSQINNYNFQVNREKIKTISFERGINIPDAAIDFFDIGVHQNGDVMAYFSINADDNTMYDFHVQSDVELYANEDMGGWFSDMRMVDSITGLEMLNTFQTLYMSSMFSGFMNGVWETRAKDIALDLDLSSWDVSNVISMNKMFSSTCYYCKSFNLNLSGWHLKKLVDASYMFSYAAMYSENVDVDLSDWKVEKLKSTDYLYSNMGTHANFLNLNMSNLRAPNVIDMSFMFYDVAYGNYGENNGNVEIDFSNLYAPKLKNVKDMFLYTCNNVEKCEINMSAARMFDLPSTNKMFDQVAVNAKDLIIDLSECETPNLIDMSQMFYYAAFQNSNNFEITGLDNWDVSKVINMEYLFYYAGKNATTWEIGNLSNWNVSSVIIMYNMFAYNGYNATIWNIGDLSRWDTSNVDNMVNMFYCAGYNAINKVSPNVSGWNVSKVTRYASFNGDATWITPPTWVN